MLEPPFTASSALSGATWGGVRVHFSLGFDGAFAVLELLLAVAAARAADPADDRMFLFGDRQQFGILELPHKRQ